MFKSLAMVALTMVLSSVHAVEVFPFVAQHRTANSHMEGSAVKLGIDLYATSCHTMVEKDHAQVLEKRRRNFFKLHAVGASDICFLGAEALAGAGATAYVRHQHTSKACQTTHTTMGSDGCAQVPSLVPHRGCIVLATLDLVRSHDRSLCIVQVPQPTRRPQRLQNA